MGTTELVTARDNAELFGHLLGLRLWVPHDAVKFHFNDVPYQILIY